MNFSHFLIHLLFLEFTLYFICAQNVVVSLNGNEDEDEEFDNSTASAEEDDAVSQLMDINSLEQFLPLLRHNGDPVTWNDMFSEYTDSSGKVVIEGGGRLAVPDDCSPRNSTVRLNLDTTEHNVIHFPRCTKIERCGGCCASPHLECRPAYTERVSMKVLKAEIPFPGSNHLIYKGFAPAIVERHVTCRVVCTLTREICGPKRFFRPNQCKCKCRQRQNCNPPKVWDPEECECKCQTPLDCCREGTNCGLVFDDESCQCLVDNGRMHISAIVNVTDEEIDNYYSSRNMTRPSDLRNLELPEPDTSGSSTPSTTPSTTTTTSTPATSTTTTTATTRTPRSRCDNIRCPPRLEAVSRNGRCYCRLRGGRIYNRRIRD